MPRPRTQTPANGAAIRAIRERTGLSVSDVVRALAEEQHVEAHPDHLRNIELGHKQPSPRLLAALAAVLRVPQTALMAAPPIEPAVAGFASFAVISSVVVLFELLTLLTVLGIGTR